MDIEKVKAAALKAYNACDATLSELDETADPEHVKALKEASERCWFVYSQIVLQTEW